jgi:endonuclease/exonuclease/phosphatase family metal-dependent hydrolase
MSGTGVAVHVATLNIRNIADRWDERLPLLLADMAALQPDLLGLQECVYAAQQDRLIGAAGEGRYESLRGWAGRPEYGNAILVRERLGADGVERIDLGRNRSAIRARIALYGGARISAVVTHLHHVPADDKIRDEQAAALLAWLDGNDGNDRNAGNDDEPVVVVGDFNAEPDEPTYRRMGAAGFRSAFLEANGAEPAVTWPSGIVAPGMDTDGDPGCLDYIWVRGAVAVESCRLVFDRPAVDDATLYPSDHLGLSARLVVGR